MEYNDVYDADRNLTGRLHRRGTRWKQGEYGLIVCVWVYDGKGKILLTQRAPEKSFAGTWEEEVTPHYTVLCNAIQFTISVNAGFTHTSGIMGDVAPNGG